MRGASCANCHASIPDWRNKAPRFVSTCVTFQPLLHPITTPAFAGENSTTFRETYEKDYAVDGYVCVRLSLSAFAQSGSSMQDNSKQNDMQQDQMKQDNMKNGQMKSDQMKKDSKKNKKNAKKEEMKSDNMGHDDNMKHDDTMKQ